MVQELFDTRIWAYVNTTKITFSNFVGIDKNARTKTLEIYPNPSEGKFFIKSSSNKLESASSKEEFKISIYDVMGQLILEHQFDLNNQSIDLSPFTNGIYFAKIGDETIKLVKH